MKIAFVAEQFVPPVFDGSTMVYDTWLRMLARTSDEVVALLFWREREPTDETHRELRLLCSDYRILPGMAQQSTLQKVARAVGRFFTHGLFAPRWLEEAGRGATQREIHEFLSLHRPDVLVVSKISVVHLLGEKILRDFPGLRILDLHDDFIARETQVRDTLDRLLARYPVLNNFPSYRKTQLRNRLSRHDPVRARRQERRLLGLFDRIMISSSEEHRRYAGELGLGRACVLAPWPIGGGAIAATPPDTVPEFHAGFVASGGELNLEGLLFLVDEVVPLIRRRHLGFRLLVAGYITEPYAMLGRPEDGVVLEGAFRDVADVYGRIRIAVVPLLSGTGVSVKTLEALRFGRPVVATPIGARGLDADATAGLHVTDGAAAMAERISALLEAGDAHGDTLPGTGMSGAAQQRDLMREYHDLFGRVCADAASDVAASGRTASVMARLGAARRQDVVRSSGAVRG